MNDEARPGARVALRTGPFSTVPSSQVANLLIGIDHRGIERSDPIHSHLAYAYAARRPPVSSISEHARARTPSRAVDGTR